MRTLILLFIFSVNSFAQDKSDFHSYEIIIQLNEKQIISAWQIELTYDKDKTKITAIEGGDAPFTEPADYDARGLTAGKIILAAFSLKKSGAEREFKVGRIHLYGPLGKPPKIRQLITVDANGKKIKAKVLLRIVKKNE